MVLLQYIYRTRGLHPHMHCGPGVRNTACTCLWLCCGRCAISHDCCSFRTNLWRSFYVMCSSTIVSYVKLCDSDMPKIFLPLACCQPADRHSPACYACDATLRYALVHMLSAQCSTRVHMHGLRAEGQSRGRARVTQDTFSLAAHQASPQWWAYMHACMVLCGTVG